MFEQDFLYLATALWKNSLQNINDVLGDEEQAKFNSNDYYYLSTIYALEEPNLSQISEALKVTKPAVSAIIRKLSKLGLVIKKQSNTDRRFFSVSLTEKGLAIMQGDLKQYAKVAEIARNVSKDQQTFELLERYLHEITLHFKDSIS